MWFHISSCGRSGSKFVAAQLRAVGLSVLHEMGSEWPVPARERKPRGVRFIEINERAFALYQGIVGWKWSILTPKLVEKMTRHLHLAREPFSAIVSATTHDDDVFTVVENALGQEPIVTDDLDPTTLRVARAVSYWLRYNRAFAPGRVPLFLDEMHAEGASMKRMAGALSIPDEALCLTAYIPGNVNERKAHSRRIANAREIIEERWPHYIELVEDEWRRMRDAAAGA